MSVLSTILTTDTFDQWRQKDNSTINTVNNLATNEGMFRIISGPNNQDIFLYNSVSGFFENQGISAVVNQVLNDLVSLSATTAKEYYFASLRNVF